MVIEWLKFKIDPESRETFIEKDNQIWTAALAPYPGFLGKEVWINPHIPDEIVLVIHWETRQQWSAVPNSVLEETERQFREEMGKDQYQLVETKEYQVRKFIN
ncbi:conserved hypothetical protein [Gloeothece citriformis PCC 7424]|uniref:ABM domain-containing protein n=1 Tax=Gloeothece citriformis (strain PCC 7424) TaxID=65393 RepID=B7KER4_GLOC7|nr:TIGR03792 family protein [Gloeothece citriformis]ACK69089.1 conserved hypothetical protein [Gloeothece citriformis PCC 7424]